MNKNWNLRAVMDDYQGKNLLQDQQDLVALLREVQTGYGGVLPKNAIQEISKWFDLKETFLLALIKRYPSLRLETVPHRLEICGGPQCPKKESAALCHFVEKYYEVKDGSDSRKGGFSYNITGCMKNCGKGPNIKWDGRLYSSADIQLLQNLVESGKKR